LRVLGQKDLIAGKAYLWIQNKHHTWKNVLDQAPIPELSGTVTVSGFRPDEEHTLSWWDSYESDPHQHIIQINTVLSQGDGSITLNVDYPSRDIAVKIYLLRQMYLPIIQLSTVVPQ
jgi:hypothetical protein